MAETPKRRARTYSGWWLVLAGVGAFALTAIIVAVLLLTHAPVGNSRGATFLLFLPVIGIVLIVVGLWHVIRGTRLIDEPNIRPYGMQSPLYLRAARRRAARAAEDPRDPQPSDRQRLEQE